MCFDWVGGWLTAQIRGAAHKCWSAAMNGKFMYGFNIHEMKMCTLMHDANDKYMYSLIVAGASPSHYADCNRRDERVASTRNETKSTR